MKTYVAGLCVFLWAFSAIEHSYAFRGVPGNLLSAPFAATVAVSGRRRRSTSRIYSNESPENESDNPFKGYNPFQQHSTSVIKSSSIAVSPRQMKMKLIISDLQRVIDSDKAMRAVLVENEEFLMEHFDNLGAFLESDTIFTPSMNRFERFDRYKAVMADRMAQAQSGSVRRILKCMTDFVLEHDERQQPQRKDDGRILDGAVSWDD